MRRRYPIPRAPDSSGRITTPVKPELDTSEMHEGRNYGAPQKGDLRSTVPAVRTEKVADSAEVCISSESVENFFVVNFKAIEEVLTITPPDQQPLDETKNTLITKIDATNETIKNADNDIQTLERGLKEARTRLQFAAEEALKPQESIKHLNEEMALIKSDLRDIEKNKEMSIRAMFLYFIMRLLILIASIYIFIRNTFISIGSIKRKLFGRKKNDRADPMRNS